MPSPWKPLAALLALGAAGCPPGHLRPLSPSSPASDRSGSSRGEPAGASSPRSRPPDPEVQRAVQAASAFVGRREIVAGGVDYGSSCVALVRAALARAGRPLPSRLVDAEEIRAYAEARGLMRHGRWMRAGDVIFLADRPGGQPAHVGLVERVEPDGTAVVLHRVRRGVMRLRVNLAWPRRTNDPATGRLVNDLLEVDHAVHPAGSLVAGAADFLR